MSTKSTSADDATAQYNAALLKLVSDPRVGTVTAKSILSPLLNDGKSGGGDERLIFDYLIKNPTSNLFSSDNIHCQGDSIYFKKPISLVRQGDAILFVTNPMEGRAISRVKIDMRNGSNGEFRGETAMKILQDETLTFNSLDDLCKKITANPQRNISAMQTGNLLAAASRESIHSRANVVPNEAPLSASGNSLSAMRRIVSPGPEHVREMIKRFNVQARITDDTSVQHDVRTRKQDLSPVIKALQEKLMTNFNQDKPLRGDIRLR